MASPRLPTIPGKKEMPVSSLLKSSRIRSCDALNLSAALAGFSYSSLSIASNMENA